MTSILLGAHVSVAGGLERAFERAHEIGAHCFQIFSKNQNRWKAKPLADDSITRWLDAWNESGRDLPIIVHASYLINIASPKNELWEKSIEALRDEIERCEQLEISMLVVHPGAHVGSGVDAGLSRMVQALDLLHQDLPGYKTRTLLEGTAGQGTVLGADFRHLERTLSAVRDPERLGVCLDTAHLHAAGHDLTTHEAYENTMEQIEDSIGFDPVQVFHLNDSRSELHSHVDRHANIGEGTMGLTPFRLLLRDERLRHLPFILETPSSDNGHQRDLQTLRQIEQTKSPACK